MLRFIFALLVVCPIFAQDQETKFTVKEIDPAKVQALAKGDAQVDAALKAFQIAQAALTKASAERDKIAMDIKAKGEPFEDICDTTLHTTPAGGYSLPAPRKWRKVEIRGSYLLISDGTSSCSGFSGTGTVLSPASGWYNGTQGSTVYIGDPPSTQIGDYPPLKIK